MRDTSCAIASCEDAEAAGIALGEKAESCMTTSALTAAAAAAGEMEEEAAAGVAAEEVTTAGEWTAAEWRSAFAAAACGGCV
jgi:hypothetical protein